MLDDYESMIRSNPAEFGIKSGLSKAQRIAIGAGGGTATALLFRDWMREEGMFEPTPSPEFGDMREPEVRASRNYPYRETTLGGDLSEEEAIANELRTMELFSRKPKE
jgi:hypothetical protein